MNKIQFIFWIGTVVEHYFVIFLLCIDAYPSHGLNKKWIFKSLLRSYINKTDLGLWDIQLLVLLNEEIEKLRNNDEDSQILKEWIRDIFENESKKN